MKVFPPIRALSDQEALWVGIRDGTIASVGSDHAPHTAEQKRQSLARQPAGAVGVETTVRVMLNEVARGRLSPEKLAWILSEGTARRYRIHAQKGTIQPGADADLTLVDPLRSWTIRDEHLHSKHSVSPWHGLTGQGAPVLAILRGRVIMREGEPVGEPMGQLVCPAGKRSEATSRA